MQKKAHSHQPAPVSGGQARQTSSNAKSPSPTHTAEYLALQAENKKLQEQANRALADYQNLVRRQQEDRVKINAFAQGEIFTSLLQPLEHLSLAATSLNDEGLNLVVKQFWEVLQAQGLSEYRPLGEVFNPTTMEAIEKVGQGEKVVEVCFPGYLLNGKPLKVAKVKVG